MLTITSATRVYTKAYSTSPNQPQLESQGQGHKSHTSKISAMCKELDSVTVIQYSSAHMIHCLIQQTFQPTTQTPV